MKKKLILNHILSLLVMLVFVVPALSAAQMDPKPNDKSTSQGIVRFVNPFKAESLSGLITTILEDIIFPIGYVLAALMVMYSGFLFVTAQGEPAKITKAKDALLYAVIGSIILLGATVITKAIQGSVDQLRRP